MGDEPKTPAVGREAAWLWARGNAVLESQVGNGFGGSAMLVGARCVAAIEAMMADGIDVGPWMARARRAFREDKGE